MRVVRIQGSEVRALNSNSYILTSSLTTKMEGGL